MRRSLLLRKQKKGGLLTGEHRDADRDLENIEHRQTNAEQLVSGTLEVVRAPLFGFYQRISDDVRKKFKLPSGCKITSKTKELRKRKSLGAKRPTQFWSAGGFQRPLVAAPLTEAFDCSGEEEGTGGGHVGGVDAEAHIVREFEPLVLLESPNIIEVPHILAQWLRPHQREGVQFMFDCVMSLKSFDGAGCILADDMGLGKTLQSIALLWTLLCGKLEEDCPIIKKAIVVCPTSLVKNWEAELDKWLKGQCTCLALSETSRADVIKNLNIFVNTRLYQVLIISYETLRIHVDKILRGGESVCELLICDEAHRLKNSETTTFQALHSLPVSKRVLLSGTPLQNDLEEFYAMAEFTNPGLLGTVAEFRKQHLNPILVGREPDATEKEKARAERCQFEMFQKVNEFILRRTNTLNAKHLPPKLVQIVCCRMTETQQNIYQGLINSKDLKQCLKGKQTNTLAYLNSIQKLCNHPKLLVMEEEARKYSGKASTTGLHNISGFLPIDKKDKRVHPELSGKMQALFLLCQSMRTTPEFCNERIVIISLYTQTLDLVANLCRDMKWPYVRLDGSTGVKKRQKLVDEFNSPHSNSFAFLLSSKAGGCGINLIGANRLVLFDPDWNPAVDKQAAARVWREGQKRRCFVYRFLTTGTLEEKIYQRQLSKEGLQSIVDDKAEINSLSSRELRNLFKYRQDTASDTHEKLRCKRCKDVKDVNELDEKKELSSAEKTALLDLLQLIKDMPEADKFNNPLDPVSEGFTTEEYERKVRHPIDFSVIQFKLENAQYFKIPDFAKDVLLVFSNAENIWDSESIFNTHAQILRQAFMERWEILAAELLRQQQRGSNDSRTPNARTNGGEQDPEAGLEAALSQGNYQGQIGMPCEEDLRSWSHHYSPETLDDPCFRRALVGSDAVSFVFGLAVTWDLIQEQQKKEAEEEKVRTAAREEMRRAIEAAEGSEVDKSPERNSGRPQTSPSPHREENGGEPVDRRRPCESKAQRKKDLSGRKKVRARKASGFIDDAEEEDEKVAEVREEEKGIIGKEADLVRKGDPVPPTTQVEDVPEAAAAATPGARRRRPRPSSLSSPPPPSAVASTQVEDPEPEGGGEEEGRGLVRRGGAGAGEDKENRPPASWGKRKVARAAAGQGRPSARKEKRKKWSCASCTFLNTPGCKVCKVCRNLKVEEEETGKREPNTPSLCWEAQQPQQLQHTIHPQMLGDRADNDMAVVSAAASISHGINDDQVFKHQHVDEESEDEFMVAATTGGSVSSSSSFHIIEEQKAQLPTFTMNQEQQKTPLLKASVQQKSGGNQHYFIDEGGGNGENYYDDNDDDGEEYEESDDDFAP